MPQQAELLPPATGGLPQTAGSDLVLMLERLATSPDVNVEKLERLIQMQKDILAYNARAAYDAAFAEMQGELPEIDERGRIIVEGQVRSTYAKNEDIQKFIRPILKRYGFALSFRERPADGEKREIVGILSHRAGHREEDSFVVEADDSGRKNKIQARGSSRSYGQRYTTIFLLNISTREVGFADDDGQTSEAPEAPKGFEAFMAGLEVLAKEGFKPVSEAWNKTKREYREYAGKHDRTRWEEIRSKAQGVDKA